MSLAGIGSYGSGDLTQRLASLLSRLDTTSSNSATTDNATSDPTTTSTVSSDGNLTGTTKPSLSGMILGTLIGLQGQNGQPSSPSPSDAVQNLFSAMDGDSDGTVSQSELESYIQSAGGTSAQADSLYSLLGGSNSSGITESQMSAAAPPPPPQGGGHGHHHKTADSSSTNQVGDQLVSLLDGNSDGSVSQSEFTGFVTAHGGSQSSAEAEFSSLSDGSGSLTASNFASAVQGLENTYTNNPYAPVLNLLDQLSQNSGSAVSISA